LERVFSWSEFNTKQEQFRTHSLIGSRHVSVLSREIFAITLHAKEGHVYVKRSHNARRDPVFSSALWTINNTSLKMSLFVQYIRHWVFFCFSLEIVCSVVRRLMYKMYRFIDSVIEQTNASVGRIKSYVIRKHCVMWLTDLNNFIVATLLLKERKSIREFFGPHRIFEE